MYYLKTTDKNGRVAQVIHFESQKDSAELIGIAPETLSRILSGKVGTTKMTAYCIVKAFDPEGEILDYFIYDQE